MYKNNISDIKVFENIKLEILDLRFNNIDKVENEKIIKSLKRIKNFMI